MMFEAAATTIHPNLRRRVTDAATVRFWLVVVLILLVDQGSKEWARQWLALRGPSVPLIPGGGSGIFPMG